MLLFRNCVVGKNYTVKISDHAMYCGRYDTEYYVSDTKARLPIRWMAWESLLLVSLLYHFRPCILLSCSSVCYLIHKRFDTLYENYILTTNNAET